MPIIAVDQHFENLTSNQMRDQRIVFVHKIGVKIPDQT